MPIWLAHRLAEAATSVRLQKLLSISRRMEKPRSGSSYKNRRPYRIYSVTVVGSQDNWPRLRAGGKRWAQEFTAKR